MLSLAEVGSHSMATSFLVGSDGIRFPELAVFIFCYAEKGSLSLVRNIGEDTYVRYKSH